MSPDPLELSGLGALLREARLAQGLSLEELAQDLHWPASLLEAVEAEDWRRIPPGQERPMVRQMAAHLGCDLVSHDQAFARVPGEGPEEGSNPRQQRVERMATLVLGLASLGALAWLLIPGGALRSLPRNVARPAGQRAWIAGERPRQPYPVLGEALPEAPVSEEGALIYLRVQDACQIRIQGPSGEVHQAVRPESPWQTRLKGPFQITLDNAGVAVLHVAGRRVNHGRAVGEAWTGAFDAQGIWLQPVPPSLTSPAGTAEEPEDPEEPQE